MPRHTLLRTWMVFAVGANRRVILGVILYPNCQGFTDTKARSGKQVTSPEPQLRCSALLNETPFLSRSRALIPPL